MKNFELMWETLKGSIKFMQAQADTPISPTAILMLMTNYEEIDDLHLMMDDLADQKRKLEEEGN